VSNALRWARDHRHLLLAYLWVVLAIPALLFWKESVLFVILLSLYANWESSLSAHNAQKAREDD
jgi:hypothetical protein